MILPKDIQTTLKHFFWRILEGKKDTREFIIVICVCANRQNSDLDKIPNLMNIMRKLGMKQTCML